ncbi:Immunity protein 31 [Izhakiella capsodis]|uniref:Immunity protein 31 n=1 Tax=Izhakiella capsodis TaxID=1367852 RepID=A0A1I4ZPS7_9GAMM|nr:Imm31 family immunity protein [Izhakiella capsodis]SFN52188.1 Immunity protein 31 [Izhakiella capsodis]
MENRIGFYQEVKISPDCKEKNKKYADKRGGVMGISEEDGIIYGYSIKLYDEEYLLSFDKDEVIPTGKQLIQDDFY